MSFVDFDIFKKHVMADDFADDDALLTSYLAAAEERVIGMTNRTLSEIVDRYGGVPESLKQAAMMLAGHWYNQREAAVGGSSQAVAFGVDALVKPYRRLVRRENDTV